MYWNNAAKVYTENNKKLIYYLYSIKYPKRYHSQAMMCSESEKHLFERILCEPIHPPVSYRTQPSIKYKRMLLCYYNRKMED